MKAVQLDTPGPIESHPLHLRDVPTPSPGRNELLIRVTACGVCRSNLHMIEGEWVKNGVPARSPIIPGHEVVGRVEAVGEGTFGFQKGDRVGVQPLWSTCLRCEYCLTGREQLCPHKQITGETVDGGYAESMLANAEHTYKVPDGLSDAEAAPLFCPGITAYGAVAKARLAPGKRVAVFGIGGVGHVALQFARLTGAEVFGVSRADVHLEVARQLDARGISSARLNPVEELRRHGGMDASIVFAPSSTVVQEAISATKPGGIIVVGVFADIGPLPFVEEKTVVGSLLGTRQQMHEVLALAAAGKVRVIAETFPLAQAEEALAKLKRGEVRARAVLTM